VKVSVICASRLQPNPFGSGLNLYLDRALMSAKRQGLPEGVELELIVGVDAGVWDIPKRFDDGVTVVHSDGKGQAAALNAGVKCSTGEVISFIEDDDIWVGGKVGIQLQALERYQFVSCNQREIDEQGGFCRYNDFATPSGWIMPRATWEKVGPFDETFRWHMDTEWLGRLNAAGITRSHIIHDNGGGRPWVANIARVSHVMNHPEYREPFVNRMINPEGGMERIRKDPELAAQSAEEHARMMERFGCFPW
jgi:glycosyltransferase involved in cell wall biosynthesis